MESAHAQAAVMLIEAGADRGRVRHFESHLARAFVIDDGALDQLR
jgi:hypothetical protein